MKNHLGLCMILLSLLLLTGCLPVNGAEIDYIPAAVSVSPSADTTAAPTEPTRSEPTEALRKPTEPEPETERPDVGLSGTAMQISCDSIVSADNPELFVSVCFPRVDLTGAPEGRICALTMELDGTSVWENKEFRLLPGTIESVPVTVSFARYQADSTVKLTATLHYQDETLTQEANVELQNVPDEVYAARSGDKLPYLIQVVRNQNVVIVYGKDSAGNYTMPVRSWLCSTGRATPYGNYKLGRKQEWGLLFGGVWGQYVCDITGDILFHSVPYTSPQKNCLEAEEYNKLGTAASMGCVRLTAESAKWIYDYCPAGTPISIVDLDALSMPRPELQPIDTEDPRAGWDPTDPDAANPWRKTD